MPRYYMLAIWFSVYICIHTHGFLFTYVYIHMIMFVGAGPNHPFRKEARFGGIMDDPAPVIWEHRDFVASAYANEGWTGPASHAPWHDTGIKTVSPLCFLPFFDLVWDLGPDMMHLNLNIFALHLFPVLAGKRYPAKPKPRVSWTDAENKKLLQDYARETSRVQAWELPAHVQKVPVLYMCVVCIHIYHVMYTDVYMFKVYMYMSCFCIGYR